MKKKATIIIFCLFFAAAFLSACGGLSPEEQRLLDGYVFKVKYHANGGSFTTNDEFVIETMHNYRIPPPGYGVDGSPAKIPTATRTGYSLAGWYRGSVDEEGTVELGERWDFEVDRVTADITLYAFWQRDYVFSFMWHDEGGEGSFDLRSIGGKLHSNNQELSKLRSAVTRPGYSLLGVYSDASYDGEGLMVFDEADKITDFKTLEHNLDPENPSHELYTQWIEGDFIFVSKASDMVYNASKTGFYLENPDKRIDFEGKSWQQMSIFGGKIIGNGHTISNMTVTYDNNQNQSYFGLIGTVNGSAYISDLTFEDCTVKVIYGADSINKLPKLVGFFAGVIKTGAEITNVSFSGNCLIDVSVASGPTPNVQEYYYHTDEGGTLSFTGSEYISRINN